VKTWRKDDITFSLLPFSTFSLSASEKKMTQNSLQMITSAVSDRGLSEKRPQNEDSYLEMPERGLFAVADGVGGAQAGDVASQMAVEQLAEAFNNFREGDVEELMHEAITRGNGAIYQMSHDLPQLSTMATTIVALQIAGNIATIGHVGDSRLYRLDSRGNLFRETQDHSVVEEEVRAGRMTPEQAENHPSKNVISRALGAEPGVEIDMKTIMFEPNTTFLLCSDGITRHISDVEIRELLALPHPPVAICGEMKRICYERGAEDNLTAVIVKVLGETASEIEESTVAAARPPFAESAVAAQVVQNNYDEIPTQNLQMPAEAQNYQTFQETAAPVTESATVDSYPNTMQISANRTEPETMVVERDEKTYVVDEPNSGGILGKILPFLLGLILGGIVGFGGYYLLASGTPPQEKPPELKPESPNIPFTTFEKSRRSVDDDPQKYITAQGATADDAEDFYLIGRANMVLGDHAKAREFFVKAKTALADYKGENKAMLTNEIALAHAVTKTETTIKFFDAEKAGAK
jgi:PPM family protein phosphatase